MSKLVEAMKANWEGYEDIRQMCLEGAEVRHDDDYVALISREVGRRISEETNKCKTNWGTGVNCDGTAATAWWSFGRVVLGHAGRQKGRLTLQRRFDHTDGGYGQERPDRHLSRLPRSILRSPGTSCSIRPSCPSTWWAATPNFLLST